MRASRILATVLAVVAAATVALAAYLWSRVHEQRLPVDRPLTVVIEPGSSVRAIGRALVEQGALRRSEDLIWAARLWGRSPPKAGEFLVQPGTTVIGLLRQLEAGAVVLHAFTIVEGITVKELRAALREAPALRRTLDGVADADLMAAIGAAPGHPEGRFLPDTYRFPRGTTDAQFLRRANLALERALAEAWSQRDPATPLRDAYQLLTLASVVERETGVAIERAAIAGVFTRRLVKGMRLQTDPTVIYGMGDRFDGNLRRKDLMTDTPYNTYTRHGLPPTPICLPSADALRAASRPATGDALYFVATGDGGHEFSVTLEQHNAAVRRYLTRLRERRAAAPR